MLPSQQSPLIWLVDPHPQRDAIIYTIRILSALMGRAARIVERLDEVDERSSVIHYGLRPTRTDSKHYAIVPDEHFWRRIESEADIAPEGVAEWRGVMFPCWAEGGVSRKLESPSSRLCSVDPVAASFFLISRIEEIRSRDVDDHGRFPAENSWMVRMGLIERPLVHEFAAALGDALEEGGTSVVAASPWPDGHQCALAFTHDVDRMRMHGSLWRDLRSGIGGLQFTGGVSAGMRRVSSLLRTRVFGKRDPYDTIDEILAGQEQRGYRSTWFWIASHPTVRNADYALSEIAVNTTICRIRDRGHEIGLHGSYESGDSPDLLTREKGLLESVVNQTVHSTRQHYLRIRASETWRDHQSAGLKIDTTLGFAGRMGFRAGLAVPFRPWDFAKQQPHDLWEVPLIMMDVTAREYMGLSPAQAIARSRQLIATVARVGGAAAVLWHNSSLNEVDWKGWDAVYESWIDSAVEHEAWSATLTEIVGRWTSHLDDLETRSR